MKKDEPYDYTKFEHTFIVEWEIVKALAEGTVPPELRALAQDAMTVPMPDGVCRETGRRRCK